MIKRIASLYSLRTTITFASGAVALAASAAILLRPGDPVVGKAQQYIIGLSLLAFGGAWAIRHSERLIRGLMLTVVRALYPTQASGLANIPSEGGVLLASNHVSYLDALLIGAISTRPVRFVGSSEMLRFRLLRWAYRKFNVIPISPNRSKEAVSKTVAALKNGEVVCVFPEGALTRTGMTMPFRKGVELIGRMAQVPVVPLHIDGMWGSVFSFSESPLRLRRGQTSRRRVRISIGSPLFGVDVTSDALREAVLDLGASAFSRRPELDESLGHATLRSLARRPREHRLTDRSGEVGRYSNGALIVLGLALAHRFRLVVATDRVGILLPPGAAGFAANLGALWSGVSAVNLNPTVGPASFAQMLRRAELNTVITSRAFLARFPDLAFEGTRLEFVEDVLEGLPLRWKALPLLAAMLLPGWVLARIFSIPAQGGEREACLLFSSGSSSEPKAIPLSHRNLIANVAQLAECCLMRSKDRILTNLPLFHSFGLTGGLWLPLLSDMELVSTPSPLQTASNIAAIREEGVTVLLGTPTFLRGYLRKAQREDLQSVRLTVSGAERLSPELAQGWQNAFGAPILQGYGLSECSPVVTANCLRDGALRHEHSIQQWGSKEGSVGRPLAGVRVRIVSVDEKRTPLRMGESGLILVSGPNVFKGYLNAEDGESRFTADGWLDTGDIGAFDSEGFLRIEGRLSRFSKIGGEMVSHQQVEEALGRAYPELQSETSEPCFVVASVPSESKGETLALVSREALDRSELAQRLRQAGLPNLWIPQKIVVLEALPRLGTGKIDLRRCAQLCAA